MKRSTTTIAWVLYIAGLILLLISLLNGHSEATFWPLIYGSLLIAIPWIICIIDYIKMDGKKDYLWLLFLISFGLPSIPVHLVKRRVKKE